jgi:cyclopropane-fatty-acyl-phospholipid synthase
MSSPAEFLDRAGEAGWGTLDRYLRERLFARLDTLHGGQLRVQDGLGERLLGQATDTQADVLASDPARARPGLLPRAGRNGSVGAGESFIDGEWDCDDLVGAGAPAGAQPRPARCGGDGTGRGSADWPCAGCTWHGAIRAPAAAATSLRTTTWATNSSGLFLDAQLMYSAAMFASPADTLEQASERKLRRSCEKLELRASDHLLEIGTGWGGMALYAAREYGCRVTTATISERQHALATQRVQEAGLGDRVTVLLRDYRDLDGHYDKLVSIEMVEAVGHQFLDDYFRRCARLLAPGGLALVQAITIEDHRYAQALRSVDFIKRHVFPGSFIPCASVLVESAARAGRLRLLNLEDFGDSYALTLRHWRQRFLAKREQARALGLDERFLRLWEFYLCYCEGGFMSTRSATCNCCWRRRATRAPNTCRACRRVLVAGLLLLGLGRFGAGDGAGLRGRAPRWQDRLRGRGLGRADGRLCAADRRMCTGHDALAGAGRAVRRRVGRCACGLHLWRRVAHETEDGRYLALRERWGDSGPAFFAFFQAQALVVALFCLPFAVVAARTTDPGPAQVLSAALVWLLSVGRRGARRPPAGALPRGACEPRPHLPRRPVGLVATSELLLRMAALVGLRGARLRPAAVVAGAGRAGADAAVPVPAQRHSLDRAAGAAFARRRLPALPGTGQRLHPTAAEGRLKPEPRMSLIELCERGLVPMP